MRIGIISDTHGLLRPEAVAALRGVDRILHAGDVGAPEVLEALAAIAPLDAVRGNNDAGPWADALPAHAVLELGAVGVLLLHDLAELPFDPADRGLRVVVAGHSHRPRLHDDGRVLWLNPGSAGPRRFALPVTVAELRVDGASPAARLVELDVAPPARRRAR